MSEYTAEMAHAAVARGAAWLDKQCPNWPEEINLDRLNLDSPTFCVLGQTAKCLLGKPKRKAQSAMRDGYDEVLYRHVGGAGYDEWPADHGFNVPWIDGDSSPVFEMLTIAWKELIRQRLEAQP